MLAKVSFVIRKVIAEESTSSFHVTIYLFVRNTSNLFCLDNANIGLLVATFKNIGTFSGCQTLNLSDMKICISWLPLRIATALKYTWNEASQNLPLIRFEKQ